MYIGGNAFPKVMEIIVSIEKTMPMTNTWTKTKTDTKTKTKTVPPPRWALKKFL